MMPRISVVIPTRNSDGTLAAAIDSVLQHGEGEVELLLCDACSTDRTLEVIEGYGSRIAWWVSEPDRGIYDAMNKAVAHARGSWLYFLGSDDQVRPEFAQALSCLLDPSTLYYGDVWLSGSRRSYGQAFGARDLARTNICHQAIFYPRIAFEDRGYDLKYPLLADWAFNMACWTDPRIRFDYLGLCIAQFNDASGLSSTRNDVAFIADYPRLLRQHFRLRDCWWPLSVSLLSRTMRRLLNRPVPPHRARPGLKP